MYRPCLAPLLITDSAQLVKGVNRQALKRVRAATAILAAMETLDLVLFLGAGASAIAGFPTVNQFLERLQPPVGAGYLAACEELIRRMEVAEQTGKAAALKGYDAEKLFARLQELVDIEKVADASQFISTTRPQGLKVPCKDLLGFLRREIVRIYGPKPPTLALHAHQQFLKVINSRLPEAKPLTIFTTNYDQAIETLIGEPTLSFGPEIHLLRTGFTFDRPGAWDPKQFAKPHADYERPIQLLKLHGSVTWKWEGVGETRLPVETGWPVATGEHDCVLYFGYKEIPSTEPFVTFHAMLKHYLLSPSVFVVIGFRFVDAYIRDIFDFALRANPNLHVVVCLTRPPEAGTPLAALMDSFPGRFRLLETGDSAPVPFGHSDFVDTLDHVLSEIQARDKRSPRRLAQTF